MDSVIGFIKNLKPIKYVTLKQKYNKKCTEYDALLEAVKNECFQAIYSQIDIPEQVKKRDRRIACLERQNKVLKEIIKEK